MKPFAKITSAVLFMLLWATSAAHAVEVDFARKTNDYAAGRLQIRGVGPDDAEALSELDNAKGLFGYKLTIPDALSKEKLLQTGDKLKNYLPSASEVAESLGLEINTGEGGEGSGFSLTIPDSIDKEKLLEAAAKLKDTLPTSTELKDASGLTDVSILIDDTAAAARAKINDLQSEANNLISAEVWNERLDQYAANIKESEVVSGVKGKFDEVATPIKEIVQNPGDTAVGRQVKAAAGFPKRLIIKIVIIIVIIFIIIGIIKAIIAKITQVRNKMAVKAVKYVVGKGVQQVSKRKQAKAGAVPTGAGEAGVEEATGESAATAKVSTEDIGAQALKYVLELGADQLNKKFNLNVQVTEKQADVNTVTETVIVEETVTVKTSSETVSDTDEPCIESTQPEAAGAKSVNAAKIKPVKAFGKNSRQRLVRKPRPREGA